MSAVCPQTTVENGHPAAFKPGNQASVGFGAPDANNNALRAGLRSQIVRNCTLGALPILSVQKQAQRFRRWLEEWVLQIHGEISPRHELALNTATRNEVVALFGTRWLKLHLDSMSHDERLRYIEAVAKASERRDRAVDRLQLDKSAQDIVGQLYGPITAFDATGQNHAKHPTREEVEL